MGGKSVTVGSPDGRPSGRSRQACRRRAGYRTVAVRMRRGSSPASSWSIRRPGSPWIPRRWRGPWDLRRCRVKSLPASSPARTVREVAEEMKRVPGTQPLAHQAGVGQNGRSPPARNRPDCAGSHVPAARGVGRGPRKVAGRVSGGAAAWGRTEAERAAMAPRRSSGSAATPARSLPFGWRQPRHRRGALREPLNVSPYWAGPFERRKQDET